MSTSLSDPNGLSTSHKTGTQGQEDKDTLCLQQQTHQDAGGSAIKKDRYVTIENSNLSPRSFLIKEVGTVSELIQKLCDLIPPQKSDAIGLRVSNTRAWSPNRDYYVEELPADVFELYVSLYLKRHPPLPPLKIEHGMPQ